MNTYEVMFLFDPAFGANWEGVQEEISRLMTRAEADVILTKRLEERRLAYEIDGCKRGLYAITYFKANGDKISGLERDVRIAEHILRALVLKVDGLSKEKMENVSLGSGALDGRSDRPRDDNDSPKRDGIAPRESAPRADGDQTPGDGQAPTPEAVASTTDDAQTKDA